MQLGHSVNTVDFKNVKKLEWPIMVFLSVLKYPNSQWFYFYLIFLFLIKENPNSPTVAEIFKGFPCCVCKAPSSGVHFGAITCEGCKVTRLN